VYGFQIVQQWFPSLPADTARTFYINSSWPNDRVHFIFLLLLPSDVAGANPTDGAWGSPSAD
jgi:hypothetical protein